MILICIICWPDNTGWDKGKGSIVPVRAVKAHMGSRGTAAVILIVGTTRTWRWTVIFMPQPLHLTERTPLSIQ